MPENDETGTEEENFRPHCIQDSQKDKRKKFETFHEIPVECSNDSEGSREEHSFVN